MQRWALARPQASRKTSSLGTAAKIEPIHATTNQLECSGLSASPAHHACRRRFDLSALALFSVLGDAKLGRREAADVSRRIGEELIAVFPAAARCTDRDSITSLIASWRALLDELKAAGYIAGYSVDESDADEALWKQKSSLSPTRLAITLNDSATLRAALLLNGRGVSPEIAQPLLAAVAASCGARVLEQTEYFLDDYRESPLEYRASQTLLSFTLAPET